MGQIFVATPKSLQEFHEQVRAIPEGYLEFYMHDDSLDLFIPEDQAALLRDHGLEFRVIKILNSDKIKIFLPTHSIRCRRARPSRRGHEIGRAGS